MSDIIQVRRGTLAAWVAANPILAEGEQGLETNTGKFKWGDGINHWLDLAYAMDIANQETFSGTAIVDFGATPDDEAMLDVTGLGNMTTTANVFCYIDGDDTTTDNNADMHNSLGCISTCMATNRVAATGFTLMVHVLQGFATGTFKIHYTYTL